MNGRMDEWIDGGAARERAEIKNERWKSGDGGWTNLKLRPLSQPETSLTPFPPPFSIKLFSISLFILDLI